MNKIVYDIDELKLKLEKHLDTLDRIRYNDKYAAQLGQPFISQMNEWAASIRRQKDQPFTVVVCGEFKRGKSSMINALLGEDVAVTDVTPETITLNRISYGEHMNALVLPGGKRMLLSDDQLRRESLEAILEKQEQGVYQLELKRPIELLKHITIVDTPGMEDAMQDYSPMVIEALIQADAVMYVFSVNYPISRREQLFIRSVLLPQKHTSVMMVGNFADMLRSENSYTRMRREINDRLSTILSGVPCYMLSALDERCRQLGADRPAGQLQSVLEEGFQALRDSLNALIGEKSAMVLPDRMERMFHGMANELLAQLDAQEHGVTVDQARLSQEKADALKMCAAMQSSQRETVEKLARDMQSMRLETQEWLFNLIAQMRQEADTLRANDALDARKYYSIYCVDTLQDALNRCTEYHLDDLYDEVDRISADLGQHFALDADKLAKQNFRFALHNKSWTKGDNVYLGSRVISSITGVDGLLSLLTMGVAGHMREKELSGKQDTVLKDIQQQFTQLEKSLPGVLERHYQQIEQELNGQIQHFFARQIEQVESASARMTEAASRSEEDKQLVRQSICEVRAMLNEMIA